MRSQSQQCAVYVPHIPDRHISCRVRRHEVAVVGADSNSTQGLALSSCCVMLGVMLQAVAAVAVPEAQHAVGANRYQDVPVLQ